MILTMSYTCLWSLSALSMDTLASRCVGKGMGQVVRCVLSQTWSPSIFMIILVIINVYCQLQVLFWPHLFSSFWMWPLRLAFS